MILGSRGDPYKNTCPLKRGIPGIFHTTFRIQVFWEVFLAGALAFWYLGSRGFRLEHYLTAAGGWGVHLHYAQQHTRKSEEKEYTSASSTQILQASLIKIFLLSKSPQINWNISWSSNCDPFWKNGDKVQPNQRTQSCKHAAQSRPRHKHPRPLLFLWGWRQKEPFDVKAEINIKLPVDEKRKEILNNWRKHSSNTSKHNKSYWRQNLQLKERIALTSTT